MYPDLAASLPVLASWGGRMLIQYWKKVGGGCESMFSEDRWLSYMA